MLSFLVKPENTNLMFKYHFVQIVALYNHTHFETFVVTWNIRIISFEKEKKYIYNKTDGFKNLMSKEKHKTNMTE